MIGQVIKTSYDDAMRPRRMALWSRPPLSRRVWCCGCCRRARVWCCGCCRRAAHGVAGAVVGLRYVVAVAMPRAVSRSLLSRRVVLLSRSRRHAVWCCGRGGCRAAWCRSRGHRRGGIVIAVGGCTVVGLGGGQPRIHRQRWW